ncbi:bacteriohopanetetrol glucosamine biosynthesis glycosyltransferase HpnI [Magnetospirillum sp. SS-4]|uniref:bacteriohopanetetrol glucosamine biosynthesis glycosyltransferase HpnI n=1 Tax=Magnetospirillum sp. SS-4 TaxID=2681465 RepID=UPI0013803ACF|nr:bacteriohopanetetrol glucosamine biosynthesis glycosyltransferase HpnI [Magnetospirillum sp. SS-4]CAA7617067.1 Hopanoid biosynthesis associated glycosyl transferase protein HpnI [Magnetospirillum sp. SS-4]
MTDWNAGVSDIVLLLLALAGIVYLSLSLRHVLAFRECVAAPVPDVLPPLSVLKPLCGAEPRLYECLRSFCDQDYPDFEIVFGVREGDDPAVTVVERLRRDFPDLSITLVSDGRLHGANLKIGNVLNIMTACRHDLLLVSDSDVEVGRDCFRAMVADMAQSDVGAVSCIYKGYPTRGWVSVLGALNINGWIVPSVLLDRALNGVDASLGPAMLLRRQALDAIGGFEAVADYLAEDHEIGERLAGAGWAVRLSAHTVHTMVHEESLSTLFRHEVRWAHTVRAVRPLDHLLTVVTCVLPLLLALHVFHPTWWGGLLLGLYLLLRLALDRAVRVRFAIVRPAPFWMVPLREILCFAVWFWSIFSRRVVWRGQPYALKRGGRLVPLDRG